MGRLPCCSNDSVQQRLVNTLGINKRYLIWHLPEKAGFDLPGFCKLCKSPYLQLKSSDDKELERLVDLLFLHGFLLSRDAF